jgi:hypothetical protein
MHQVPIFSLPQNVPSASRDFFPVSDLDFENFDRPVAERITPRFRDSAYILPSDLHAYQRKATPIVPRAA